MLGNRIAILRRQHGMSQAQLAKEIRVSPSTIGMYEQGRRTPDIHILMRIAEVFNTSIDRLVKGTIVIYPSYDTFDGEKETKCK